MATFKKHRFKLVFSIVMFSVFVVASFLYCVHTPFVDKQHDLVKVRNRILEENKYVYDDYFYEYNDAQTLYIIRVIKDDKSMYLVYDEYYNELDSFKHETKDIAFVEGVFSSRYDVESDSIEIAYENDRFVYFVRYAGKEELIYAYYDLYSGQFIKGIQL